MKQLPVGTRAWNEGGSSPARLSAGAVNLALGLALVVLGPSGASTAQAHPGHALGEHGAGHVISSPYHLFILAVTGLLLWLGARFVQRRLPRRLLQAGGLAAVAGAALMWGLRV